MPELHMETQKTYARMLTRVIELKRMLLRIFGVHCPRWARLVDGQDKR